MKTRAEVKRRVRALLVQELDRRVAEAGKRLPRRCCHNYQHPLDDRKQVDGEPNADYNRIGDDDGEPVGRRLGLCMLNASKPEEWNGTICEDPIDAQRCPFFEPHQSKQELLAEFQAQLAEPGGLDEHMPAVAELLWVVDGAVALKLPWWKRLWFWLLRIHVEPVRHVARLEELLGGSDPPALPEGEDEG